PDHIVALEVERSLEMIISIMAVLKAGAAYLPISPGLPAARKNYMIKDSGAKILLRKLNPENKVAPNNDIKIIDIDSDTTEPSNSSNAPNSPNSPNSLNSCNSYNSLAYLIYTSGTTGKPKGVVIEHRSVVNLVEGLRESVYRYTKPINVSLVSPYIFDASVKQIFPTLLLGHALVVVPEEKRFDGDALVTYYKEHNVTVSDGTPVHLKLIINSHEIGTGFPVKQFVIGGDALERELVEAVMERLGGDDISIVNVYGPTECTDVATTYTITRATGTEKRIPIGKPISNTNIYILGHYGEIQGIGVPGELHIGGTGLGRGYLNNPELTAEKFIKAGRQYAVGSRQEENKEKIKTQKEIPFYPNNQYPITNNYFYRTGDLACWQSDGNIAFLGRLDHQVKIRGFRIEPGEIESRMLKHPDISEAVAVVLGESKDDRYLCTYIVSQEEIPLQKLREYLSRDLPDYMLPSNVVRLEKIPLTPSGKVHRKGLPEPGKSTQDTYRPPRDGMERKLVEMWAGSLGLEKERIGIDDNFFQMGGHSLKATILITNVHKELDVKVPLAEIFKRATIRGMADYIKKTAKEKFLAIEPAPLKEYYSMSPAQKRLYILQQMDMQSTAYNMPYVIPLTEELTRKNPEATFKELIKRHESLRTSFHMQKGIPVQVVHDNVTFKIERFKTDTTVDEEKEQNQLKKVQQEFFRTFELSEAPLLRVGIAEMTGKNTVTHTGAHPKGFMLIDMHHIVTDGTSQALLIKEFNDLNRGETLLPLRLQYKDYAQWQNSSTHKQLVKEQEEYWTRLFSGELPVLNLPTDYPRPAIQSFDGNIVSFELNKN
ncbi:MAG: amino acid adenylation domain-containing protein, partial [bacterium]|nr:amino acid adenylation domain-containing protein [bacterium]